MAFTDAFEGAFNDLIEGNLLLVRVAVAASRRSNGAACLGCSFTEE